MRPSETLGGKIDRGEQLWLYCNNPHCRRQLDCDVYDLAERFGPDTNWVARRWPVRCATCDSREIGMITPGESRPASVVREYGPSNLRNSRTPEEREKALAMVGLDAREALGLSPLPLRTGA